jgi:hypothetical protein
MKHRALVRLLVVAIATSVAAACTAPGSSPAASDAGSASSTASSSASASSGPWAAPSPAMTESAAPVASPAATPTPTTESSAPPVAAKPLVVDWTRRSLEGLDGIVRIVATASQGATTVLLGRGPFEEGGQPRSSIWRSTDGRHWERVLLAPAGQHLGAIAAGGPGFVAVGGDDHQAVVLTSADGTRWHAAVDDALDRGSMRMVVATQSGIVAFGGRVDTDSRVIWTSPDGIEWLAATNASGLRVARGVEVVAAMDGRALAFVGPGDYLAGRVEVWATTGRAKWEQVATLPGGDQITVLHAAGGPRGWVALGTRGSTPVAWYSEDGRTWERAATGPDVTSSILGVDAGFIATGSVGSLMDETCGDQRAYHGHTWTSADGRTWQHMAASKDFEWASVSALLVVGRNLVGIGGSYPGVHASDSFVPTRWTAPLPSTGLVADSSDRPSTPQTCGG